MFRDGTDEWVTGETLDATIKCNEMEIYTSLENQMQRWRIGVLPCSRR
jgi:hypothetical protein